MSVRIKLYLPPVSFFRIYIVSLWKKEKYISLNCPHSVYSGVGNNAGYSEKELSAGTAQPKGQQLN